MITLIDIVSLVANLICAWMFLVYGATQIDLGADGELKNDFLGLVASIVSLIFLVCGIGIIYRFLF